MFWGAGLRFCGLEIRVSGVGFEVRSLKLGVWGIRLHGCGFKI